MIDKVVLKEMIESKFSSQTDFAKAANVSRNAVHNWLIGENTPTTSHLLDIVGALELNEVETGRLMAVPEVSLRFRKKGGDKLASSEARKFAKDLADTFFKLEQESDAESPMPHECFSINDPELAAVTIRDVLGLEPNQPVTLEGLIAKIRERCVSIYFYPFQKVGLAPDSDSREVALSAFLGNRISIFMDTNRTKDESLWDLCHEMAHIILNEDALPKGCDIEGFCNKVAQYLIYPKKVFEKNRIAALIDELRQNGKVTWDAIVRVFTHFSQYFDWSPMGLALALADYGLIRRQSKAFRFLMKFHKASFEKKTPKIDVLFFEKFEPSNFASMSEFFQNEIHASKEVFSAFWTLKDSAIAERISYRQFAKILGMDSGDTDELVRGWRQECEG